MLLARASQRFARIQTRTRTSSQGIVVISSSSRRSFYTLRLARTNPLQSDSIQPTTFTQTGTRSSGSQTRKELQSLSTSITPFKLLRTHSTRSVVTMSTSSNTAAPVASLAGGGEEFFRLPTHTRPTHYDLTILSDLQSLRFSGLVTIHLDVIKETDQIVLNAGEGLNVNKAAVQADALKTENKSIVSLDVDKKHERITAKLATTLPKGSKATISVAFESEIDASMMGYYRSTWEHEGKKGFYALTQFEATAARKAFPCFDEPEAKATYSFTMIHRKDTTALANMPAISNKPISRSDADKLLRLTELGVQSGVTEAAKTLKTEVANAVGAGDEWEVTSYDKLPLVSSYLVAFANGPFQSLESSFKSPITGRTVPIKIYTTAEYIHQAQFALDVTARAVPVYEKIFKQEYPLPKLDTLVASDFDAGAMENWGLITGRTSVYLYDPLKSGLQGMKRTASVQSHEIAHQWFGNIVTPKWWDNLWLNEAFATLMGEVIILDRLYPEWDSASEFIGLHLERAFELDAKRSSHPIELPLKGENVEDAIAQIFDACSYSKGGSVLRMLAAIVGEDVFLNGVAIYLSKHLYSNAETKDLWAGISESSGLDVARIMSNWILKIGYPVITVEEKQDSIVVRQNRFLSTGDVKPEEDETLWYVPLQLKTVSASGEAKVDPSAVLDLERSREIALKDVKNSTWKLNADTIGVYRVAYEPARLAKLGAEAAKPNSAFSLQDRVGLVSDAFTLAKATDSKTSAALTLVKELRNDPTYLVQSMISTNLAALASTWYEQPEAVRSAIDHFRAEVFGGTVQKLGFEFPEGESPDTKQLRATAIAAAAAGGDEHTLKELRTRFAAWQTTQDESGIHPDILRTVYATAVKHGGEAEYESVLGVWRKPPTPTHKIAAHLALCATREEKLIQRTLTLTLEEVKTQDFMYTSAGLGANLSPQARKALWNWIKQNWDKLNTRFAGNNFSFGNIVKYALSNLADKEAIQDAESFFEGKQISKISMALAQSLDSIRTNVRWLDSDKQDVEQWLKSNGYLK
ncbi:putative AAP1-alanine/arginine aminopeptidase [Ceraceosorus guamensis]|uniref:Putative AAP1-alanine/arginine aminopeptidase n=1 Tax=Ceraceosorus guamensis TaxID=1522189 RepID=A0A316W5A9_9BASI|nr:putative AAP1-alanine/arginine aminopeptidase [Ceraceosorus guamensis]PWN42825.1 putative AAP1-alanine/arginine aminopeptidase [Ceraceosorus guamensis]